MAATTDTVTGTIRAYLAAEGVSQGSLARRMGVSAHWLSRRFSGKCAWSTDDIDQVAEALGTSGIAILAGIAPERRAVAA